MAIPDTDMPQLFRAADRASRSGQNTYLWLTRVRLSIVVLAAACGVASWRIGKGHIDVLAVLGLLLFVAALLLESYLWNQHPERDWYDGRAVAESAKTLAWKFSVGGQPFPTQMTAPDAERAFIRLLDKLRESYAQLNLHPVIGTNVTHWMRSSRTASLQDRRNLYIAERINDQQGWYQQKYMENKRRARIWKVSLVTFEFLGAVSALAEAITQMKWMLTPLIAAAIAAVAAWLETKQHDRVARAYGTTVTDLASALDKLASATKEEDWAREMNDAEEAISREHTLWLASRSQT